MRYSYIFGSTVITFGIVVGLFAFGSRLIHDPSGGISAIAKVTRKYTNSEVTRQIQAYLVENKYPEPHPCPRTIMKILENMKASISKSLEGICPSHENCSRAFDSLTSILSELKKIPELYELVPPVDIERLAKIINTGKIYIKNVFRYQVNPSHSKIRSHCIRYGCSAKDNKNFSSVSDCRFFEDMMETDLSDDDNDNVHDGVGCDQCEAIPKIFQVMTGIVRSLKDQLLPTDIE